jgi:hypothetical protein
MPSSQHLTTYEQQLEQLIEENGLDCLEHGVVMVVFRTQGKESAVRMIARLKRERMAGAGQLRLFRQ